MKNSKFIKVGEYEVYAIDKNNVYYLDDIIEGADVKSFKTIGYLGLAKDKNNIYYKGEKIIEIDPDTFEVTYTKRKPDPVWGYWCDGIKNDETYKDKNGEYTVEYFKKALQKIKQTTINK